MKEDLGVGFPYLGGFAPGVTGKHKEGTCTYIQREEADLIMDGQAVGFSTSSHQVRSLIFQVDRQPLDITDPELVCLID